MAYFEKVSKKKVSQILLKYLKLEGVKYIFGIPGGATKQISQDLRLSENEFQYIITRQETGAAYMADGYYRVTGTLGVVLVTAGPGATNALTGSVTASCGNSAVLTISGEVPEKYFGMAYHQEGADSQLEVNSVYRNAVRSSSILSNPNNFHTLFAQALRDAQSIPRQAVHVSLPDDIAASVPTEDIPFPNSVTNYRVVPDVTSPEKSKRVFDHLMSAKRPLVFIGNGCRFDLQGERQKKFVEFCNRFAIPVMTTPDGKAIFPENDAMSLRTYGLAACEWPQYYLKDEKQVKYDCLLVLGSSLGDTATQNFNPDLIPDGPFVQVDLNQSVIGRAFPVEMGIVANVGRVIDDLLHLADKHKGDECRIEERRKFIAKIKDTHSPFYDPEKRNSLASPILPQALSKCINDVIPTGTQIFLDAGNCIGWGLHYLVLDAPTQIHSSLGMGPIGWGVGSVVGGKLGAPDKVCLAYVGDGAFLMHGNEVSTAAQYGIGAIWVVMFNDNYQMVTDGNEHFFPKPKEPLWEKQYPAGNPDLVKFSEGLGARAYHACTVEETQKALKQAIENADKENRPQVIVVDINRVEVPPFWKPAKEEA